MAADVRGLPDALGAGLRRQLVINRRAMRGAAGVVPAVGADGIKLVDLAPVALPVDARRLVRLGQAG